MIDAKRKITMKIKKDNGMMCGSLVPMTEKQRDLIDSMNEFCGEKFEYSDKTTKKEASEYISRNIGEFKLAQMDNWNLKYL